jgi:hypothetical protein
MNKLAYDVFFEKIAGPLDILKVLEPHFKELAGAGANIVKPHTTSAMGHVMNIALPVGFMGMEGVGAIKNVKKGVHGLPPAMSLPQTANPYTRF